MTPDQRAQRIGWALSLGCLVLLVVLDIFLSSSVAVLTGLFGLAPLFASAVLPARSTALLAVLATAAGIASGWWNHEVTTSQHFVRVIGVVVISSTAVAISLVRVHREKRFAAIAQIAEVAQRAILPTLPHTAGDIEIHARYESAVEGALVGGDLYDCYISEDATRLLIGDVRGKGIGGVEQASRVIRAFRQAAARQRTLTAVAADMDAYLTPFFDDEEFVTALLVEAIGPDRLELVNAGHPPALLLRDDDGLEPVEVPPALPLGTGLPSTFTAVELTWKPGDRLLLYTDGLSEARDSHGVFLDLADIRGPLAEASGADALDAILDVVRAHVRRGRLGDDLALVLLEHQPVTAGLPAAR